MNRIYRLVFNPVRGVPQAVSEIAQGAGGGVSGTARSAKRRLARRGRRTALGAAGLALAAALPAGVVLAQVLPAGGLISSGVGDLVETPGVLNASQSTEALDVNWQTFNVGAASTVYFHQPDSQATVINRVVNGAGPSVIGGVLRADGRVVLSNSDGINVSSTASFNTNALLLTSLDIAALPGNNGGYVLTSTPDRTAVVANSGGTINAGPGGSVSLVGAAVLNNNAIGASTGGRIELIAAAQAGVSRDANGAMTTTIERALASGQPSGPAVNNAGMLTADGGTVVLQAAAVPTLFTDLVTNQGSIFASSLEGSGGSVTLSAQGGNVVAGGTIDVTGASAGGHVDLVSDAKVSVTGSILAGGVSAGGSIDMRGGAIELNAGHAVNAGSGSISLVSAGAITQVVSGSPGEGLAAGTLTGSSGGATQLIGSNRIASLGDFSAQGLQLTNAQSLMLNGTLDGGASLTLDVAGALTLGGDVTGFSTALQAMGAIVQTSGTLTASTLALDVVGDVTLNNLNQIGALGNADVSGALSLTTGQPLTVSGNVSASRFVLNAAGNTLVTGSIQTSDTGANGGTTVQGGNLQIGNGGTQGALAGNVKLDTQLIFNRRDALTYAGSFSGAGALVQFGSGTLTLTGASDYSGGTTVTAGTLRVNNGSGSATGSGAVQVDAGATLAGGGIIAGAVHIADGATLSPGNSPGTLTTGALQLDNGAILNYELGQAGAPGGALNDLVDVKGNLVLGGTLNVTESAGGNFGPGLYRLMTYSGGLTDHGLSIGALPSQAAAADQYLQTSVAGQVNLINSSGASLNFWDGSDPARYNDGTAGGGTGTWRLGGPHEGWADADGTLNTIWKQNGFAMFGGQAGTVTVDNGGGNIAIGGAQFFTDGYVLDGNPLTLGLADTLIKVGDGTASGARMTATIESVLTGTGGLVKDDMGTLVLKAANDYSGGTRVRAGVLQGNTVSLQGDIVNDAVVDFEQAVDGSYAGTMSGSGSLRKRGGGELSLTAVNSYSGGTLIDAGTVKPTVAGALGSGRVAVASGAGLDIAGMPAGGLAIGALEGAGRVLLGANALTVGGLGADTEFSGVISGAGGSLEKVGMGALTLSSANSYTGGTALHQGRLNLGDAQALGSGALSMDDDTTLGFSADGLTIANAIQLSGRQDPVIDTGAFNGTLSGAISGAGFITKQGTGTLTLSGANSYTGATEVAQGSLRAGAANTLSAASAHKVAAGATLDLAGFSQSVASLANSGTVSLVGSTPGTTLTVNGPYVGDNGVLKLGTVLNGAGPSDRLVLNGASAVASGTTRVQIVNLNGLGALTSGDGIEVISAQNGASTTAQTRKDAFSLAGGHVDAGAYEYRLHAADANGAGENWYLRSTLDVVPPGDAGPAPVITYRPEAALYAALPSQLRQANLAMLGDMHKRVGDDDVTGADNAGSQAGRRAWARVLSSDIDIAQGGDVSPTSEGRLSGFQAGTDLLAAARWRAGVYVGQLDGDVRVNGFASGLRGLDVGRNDLRSQYLGVYGTYASDSGAYADAVLQAGRHRYTVEANAASVLGAEGKGDSGLASIEVGQAFALGGSGWRIEPQLQLVHQSLDLDAVSIAGAGVQPQADSGWLARAGVRVKGELSTGAGALQPYGRFNVYRASNGVDVAQFVSGAGRTDIAAPIGGTSTELAGGFTLALNAASRLYGEIGRLWSAGGDARVKSGINGSVGVRVTW